MLFIVKKAISINAIFQKEKDGSYTKNARLYQDMLRYVIEGKNRPEAADSFRHWELAKWLMTHNNEFSNFFKDPSTRTYTVPNKVENTQRRTKDKLSDLVELKLIRILGTTKQKKGTGLVDLYEYTLPGYLIALLLKVKNEESRGSTSETTERVLGIIHTCTKTNDSRSLLFINKFLRNCATKGSFLAIVGFFVEAILPAYTLSDGRELLLLFLGLRNSLNWILADPQIFRKTLEELDGEEKKIILLQFKLEIEGYYNKNYLKEDLLAKELNSRIGKELDISFNQDYSSIIMVPTMAWEMMRFNNISDYSKVTIPAFCETCRLDGSFLLGIYTYLDSIVHAYCNPEPSQLVGGNCSRCGTIICTHIMRLPHFIAAWR
jgi:hypothetical protein